MSDSIDYKNMTSEELEKVCSSSNEDTKEIRNMALQLLEANEELREADANKQKFMSLIKNEFNNPMNVLLNLSKRLTSIEDVNRAHEIGGLLNKELLRMDFQLKNIFAITELESGLLSNIYSKVDMVQLIEDVKSAFLYLINEKNIHFSVSIDETIDVVTDGGKLYLILLNLISNACEFSVAGSLVSISLSQQDDKHIIEIRNQGSKLPEIDNIESIFNMFTSYNQESIRPCTGLGIGLSVVSNMIKQLGADIKYGSDEGQTFFSIVLPQRELKEGESSCSSQEVFFDEMLDSDSDDAIEF